LTDTDFLFLRVLFAPAWPGGYKSLAGLFFSPANETTYKLKTRRDS